jgi:hypothetical protein
MSVCPYRRTLALVALSTVLAGPALAAGSSAAQRQDLHGIWRLNEDLTARMKESQGREGRPEGRRMDGGMGRRGPGGPGDPGGLPGGLPGGGDFEEPPEKSQHENAAPPLTTLNEVTIEQAADKVTITDGYGHKRVLWTDNRKARDEQAPGGPAQVRAKWDDDGSLVVEVTPAQGPRRTETWLVSNDRKLLYLTVEMADGRLGGRIRRAYSAAAPGEPAKKPEPKPDGAG